MNIFEFAKKIKTAFTKGSLQSEIDSTRDIIINQVLPTLAGNRDFFLAHEKKLVSKTYTRDRDSIVHGFADAGYLRPSNPFTMLELSFQNSVKIIDFIERWFDKSTPEEQLNGQSITLAKANVLQLLDGIGFAGRYTLNWLNVVLSAESKAKDQIDEHFDLTPDMIKYLGDNQQGWIKMISLMSTPVEKIEPLIEGIPNVIVAEANPKALTAAQGNSKVDPLRFGFIQHRLNPIWSIGAFWADYQADRYKETKELKETIQLRVHRLKSELSIKGGTDPRLVGIIEKREAQLDKVVGRLRKMEKKYYDQSR